MAAVAHGRPSPRKTLTELEPVMLTIEASAYGSEAGVAALRGPQLSPYGGATSIAQRNPTWLLPVSGEVPRRAAGR